LLDPRLSAFAALESAISAFTTSIGFQRRPTEAGYDALTFVSGGKMRRRLVCRPDVQDGA
jgi:hypothetical protein